MADGDEEKPGKGGMDPEAHIAIGKKRMFQVTDEATIRRASGKPDFGDF